MTKLLGAAPAADDDAATKGFVDDKVGASTDVNTATVGQIPIADGAGDAAWADPAVQGVVDHDADASAIKPVLTGGYAKDGAAPTSVSADGDAVRDWNRRSGAKVVEVINPGAIGGGTQYTEADTDASITGTAMLWEDASDTLRAVSVAKPLPVQAVGTGTNAASQVTITNSSTTVIAARAGRRGVGILNKQTVRVSIDISGGTAVYATHFVLDPGAWIFLPVTNAVTAITSAAYTASGDAKLHLTELY